MQEPTDAENPFRSPSAAAPDAGPTRAAPGAPKQWNPIDALTFAWEAVVAHPMVLLAVFVAMVIQMAIPMIGGGAKVAMLAAGAEEDVWLSIAVDVVTTIINLPIAAWMTLGLARVALDLSRGGRPSLGRLFDTQNYLTAILSLLLMYVGATAFMVVVGGICIGPGLAVLAATDGEAPGWLLLIPGALVLIGAVIYVSSRVSWFMLAVADGAAGPVAAFSASLERTRGQVLWIILLHLLLAAVTIAGVLLGICPGLILGMFVTLPAVIAFAQVAPAYAWLRRSGEDPRVPR